MPRLFSNVLLARHRSSARIFLELGPSSRVYGGMTPVIGKFIETMVFFAVLAEIREGDRMFVPSTSEGPPHPSQAVAQGCQEGPKLARTLNL